MLAMRLPQMLSVIWSTALCSPYVRWPSVPLEGRVARVQIHVQLVLGEKGSELDMQIEMETRDEGCLGCVLGVRCSGSHSLAWEK
jgi:hypothetical protein